MRATSEAANHSIQFVPVPAVLMVRTYAVWNRDKRVGIGLALLFILCQTAAAVTMEVWAEGAHRGLLCPFIHLLFRSTPVPASAKPFLLVIQNPYPEITGGCFADKFTNLIFSTWIVITIEEGGTLRT